VLNSTQWESYRREGYLRLGKVLDDAALVGLTERIDEIMLGKASLDYNKTMMQLDSDTGKYEDAKPMTKGFKGPTLSYRKIEELEYDSRFLAYIQHPVFKEICAGVYDPDEPIACYRAMFMNKPPRRGTFLPWHQDRWIHLDRDPRITVWTALDPATKANGCVQIIPGSHKLGLINPDHHSGFPTPEQVARYVSPEKIEFMELAPGESVLLDNLLLHSSDVNNTDIPRRAFSVCYMSAHTVASNGIKFNTVFGAGAMTAQTLQTASS
jgi:phytanoyl-CoA hydroxylase